jgi:hypothetical protein
MACAQTNQKNQLQESSELAPSQLDIGESKFVDLKISNTYFVKLITRQSVLEDTLKELLQKKCWKFSDIVPESYYAATSRDCHAFKAFKNESDIAGKYKHIGASFLIQITEKPGVVYNIQMFEKDGKTLRRILNAGDFDTKKKLSPTLVSLTFK